jgi:hypothetical protein
MTIQSHSDTKAFAVAAAGRPVGRGAHPRHGARHNRDAGTHADLPASTLFWMLEALVLGPDRSADSPRPRTRRLRVVE